MAHHGGALPPIDFVGLNAYLLGNAEALVAAWLPGGKRVGHEYVCGSLSGGAGRSCSINLNSGAWADFQSGEAGGDLVSLYAAIHGMKQHEAALELRGHAAMGDAAPVRTSARPAPAPKPPPADEGWATQRPVPPHAPAPTFRHQYRKPEDIENRAEYRVGDELHGYVVRFRTSADDKEDIPYTWCVSTRHGGTRWHWKQFDAPRPLYLPGQALPGRRTVLVVEGEIKADVLQELLEGWAPGVYCVVSWPGGCKAWGKADWSWLAGCNVLLWPDCDAKHVPLTPAERKATPEKLAQSVLLMSKPLLPAEKQGGMAAMLGIGALLRDTHACKVQLLPIPQPGTVKDGWDCKDAIRVDGWGGDRVLAFFGQAQPLSKPEAGDDAAADAAPRRRSGSSGDGPPDDGKKIDSLAEASDSDDAFADHLAFICEQLKCKVWDLGVNRKLLITALTKAPDLAGCLGFNELTNAPGTVKAWPWRDEPGLLAETDDLRLGDWLSREYKLKAASRAALAEAIDTVADMHRFHPIRDWLTAQEWDGKPRLTKWLMHVLGMDREKVVPRRQHYLGLVGRYMLMGLVARVMDPGVKFDYSPVFEGLPGVGKSTLVAELVGKAYFSDTHFDIGNGKDGMEQLEGLWAYELSELTAFKRADSEQIKQFFSSTVDRFRGAYGKFVQPHKRQCVIFCTTNKRQYLYDLTGNRRFWPVWIDQQIKLEWLRKWRGQLFAEALAAWRAGERYHPTKEEEDTYFVPEQELRLVETTVQSKLYEMLTREGAATGEGRASTEYNQNTGFVTLHGLVQALGADAAKSSSLLETQIRGWLESNGWEHGRETGGQRRRGYRQPAVWPPKIKEDEVMGGPGASQALEATPATDDLPARAGESDGMSDDEPF